MFPYECNVCQVRDLEEPHTHQTLYKVSIRGHFIGYLFKFGDVWINSSSQATRFTSLEEAGVAVKAFVKQKQDPPLNDGFGTIIVAHSYELNSDLTLEASLDRQDTVIEETVHQVLWRSRPKGTGAWTHLDEETEREQRYQEAEAYDRKQLRRARDDE